jgi:hypothetical protein
MITKALFFSKKTALLGAGFLATALGVFFLWYSMPSGHASFLHYLKSFGPALHILVKNATHGPSALCALQKKLYKLRQELLNVPSRKIFADKANYSWQTLVFAPTYETLAQTLSKFSSVDQKVTEEITRVLVQVDALADEFYQHDDKMFDADLFYLADVWKRSIHRCVQSFYNKIPSAVMPKAFLAAQQAVPIHGPTPATKNSSSAYAHASSQPSAVGGVTADNTATSAQQTHKQVQQNTTHQQQYHGAGDNYDDLFCYMPENETSYDAMPTSSGIQTIGNTTNQPAALQAAQPSVSANNQTSYSNGIPAEKPYYVQTPTTSLSERDALQSESIDGLLNNNLNVAESVNSKEIDQSASVYEQAAMRSKASPQETQAHVKREILRDIKQGNQEISNNLERVSQNSMRQAQSLIQSVLDAP